MLKVNCASPPAVIVITSEPLNVIDVLVSPSPAMLSNCTAPTFDNAASPKSTAPATVNVPDTSTLPFMSIVVAAICTSESATKSNCPSVDELMYIAVSLKNNFSSDDCVYILRIFILKIKRLLKIHENLKVTNNLETTISSYKPTIFWKEKEIVKQQINKLDIETLNSLITKTNDIELLVKKRPLLSTYVVSNFIIEQTN